MANPEKPHGRIRNSKQLNPEAGSMLKEGADKTHLNQKQERESAADVAKKIEQKTQRSIAVLALKKTVVRRKK